MHPARLVLDASAAVDILASTRRRHAALRAMAGHELYAPQVIDLEVLSAVARLERAGTLDRARSERALADWQALPIERIDSHLLAGPAWALRQAVRLSDAFYLAAAAGLRLPLLTSDARLSRSPVKDVTFTLLA